MRFFPSDPFLWFKRKCRAKKAVVGLATPTENAVGGTSSTSKASRLSPHSATEGCITFENKNAKEHEKCRKPCGHHALMPSSAACSDFGEGSSVITARGDETEICGISTSDLDPCPMDPDSNPDSELISDFNENSKHMTPTTSIVEDLVNLDEKMQSMQISCGQLVRKCISMKTKSSPVMTNQCPNCQKLMIPPSCSSPHRLQNHGPIKGEETTSAYNSGVDSCMSTPFLNGRPTGQQEPLGPHFTRCYCVSALSSPCVARKYPSPNLDMAKIAYVHYNPGSTTVCTTFISSNAVSYSPYVFGPPPVITEHVSGRLSRRTKSEDRPVSEQSKRVNGLIPAQSKVSLRNKSHCSLSTKRKDILRKRAEKLRFERQGVSTDDDAASDLKIGRYWTREERIRHLQKARERQRYRAELLEQKRELAKQRRQEANIVDLAHNKVDKKQGKQLLDKFTTIQEYLAHHGSNAEKNLPKIFTVTTV